MIELSTNEIEFICGGMKPIENPQSEIGKAINDIVEFCDTVGKWIGNAIYDATH